MVHSYCLVGDVDGKRGLSTEVGFIKKSSIPKNYSHSSHKQKITKAIGMLYFFVKHTLLVSHWPNMFQPW